MTEEKVIPLNDSVDKVISSEFGEKEPELKAFDKFK